MASNPKRCDALNYAGQSVRVDMRQSSGIDYYGDDVHFRATEGSPYIHLEVNTLGMMVEAGSLSILGPLPST